MEKNSLQIDKTIPFMTSIGKLDILDKKPDSNKIPDPPPAYTDTKKETRKVNYANILLVLIISWQLWYLANEYISRANAAKHLEQISKEKAFNEKQQALKTQSENFARDANNTIERIYKIVHEIHELKKDTTYVPEKLNAALNLYNSTLFYIKQKKFEKASKMAI
ncbi:hypothetical protein HY745_12050, partial [Candidatus Desantisbacteria bacterium]|nr:hypothetical protein [Candidatus Desantisbacteria bacterium]